MDEIGKMLQEGWGNFVWPKIQEWANTFWQWVTGANGAQAQVPGTMNKLLSSIQAWSNDPKTQEQLAQFGDSSGRGLVKGVEFLVGQAETWAPILTKMGQAMAEALPKVAYEVGGSFGAYFLKGLAEQLGLGSQFKGGLQGLMNLKHAVTGSGGSTTNSNTTNQTIYGGVQVVAGAYDLYSLLSLLVP